MNTLSGRMTCARCQGCLTREDLYRHGRWWWRCLNCGDRSDRTIILNRGQQISDLAYQRAAQDRDQKEWATWLARRPQLSA